MVKECKYLDKHPGGKKKHYYIYYYNYSVFSWTSRKNMNELFLYPQVTFLFHTFCNQCPISSDYFTATCLYKFDDTLRMTHPPTPMSIQEIVLVYCHFQMMEKHKRMEKNNYFCYLILNVKEAPNS